MAKPPKVTDSGPGERPSGPPPIELYAMSDIRVVIRDLGKIEGQVERLIADVGLTSSTVGALQTSVDRFKTALIVIGACLGIFLPMLGGILWWAVGERIDSVLRPHVSIQAPQVPTSPPPTPPSP